jgi:cytochrome P450
MAINELVDFFHRSGVSFRSAVQFVLLAAAALYCAVTFARWYRLRHFKGPWLASLSEFWISKTLYGGHSGHDFIKLNRKYGHIARIGPNDLITDDADVIRFISDVKKSGFVRSDWYESLRIDPDHHTLFTTPEIDYHDKMKSKMMAGYGKKGNPGLEQSIDDLLLSMFSLIETKYLSSPTNTKKLDLGKTIQYFTLDVITKLCFGYPLGFIETDGDVHKYIETVETLVKTVAIVSGAPTLRKIFNMRWVIEAVGPMKDKTKGFGKLLTIGEEIVKKRLKDEEEQFDMLGSFMRHGLNQKDLEGAIFLNMVGGSDTTASGLRATLLNVITNPRVLRRLRREIDDFIASSHVSRPIIQSSEAKSLAYLQACIREGLRMHPPAAALFSKVSPDHPVMYQGTCIPPKTRIAHNLWGILQNKDVFGEDSDVYRPERWLDEGVGSEETGREDRKMRMLKDLDLIFGFGKWT